MIEVQHLTKRYGPFTAVDDISFKVERGEILGPNGAGKTSTMRILTGYMPATECTAIVAGFDVFDEPIEAKWSTGYLPETPPLYPDMTVLDCLTLCAEFHGSPRDERTVRIRECFEGDSDMRAHTVSVAEVCDTQGVSFIRTFLDGLRSARPSCAPAAFAFVQFLIDDYLVDQRRIRRLGPGVFDAVCPVSRIRVVFAIEARSSSESVVWIVGGGLEPTPGPGAAVRPRTGSRTVYEFVDAVSRVRTFEVVDELWNPEPSHEGLGVSEAHPSDGRPADLTLGDEGFWASIPIQMLAIARRVCISESEARVACRDAVEVLCAKPETKMGNVEEGEYLEVLVLSAVLRRRALASGAVDATSDAIAVRRIGSARVLLVSRVVFSQPDAEVLALEAVMKESTALSVAAIASEQLFRCVKRNCDEAAFILITPDYLELERAQERALMAALTRCSQSDLVLVSERPRHSGRMLSWPEVSGRGALESSAATMANRLEQTSRAGDARRASFSGEPSDGLELARPGRSRSVRRRYQARPAVAIGEPLLESGRASGPLGDRLLDATVLPVMIGALVHDEMNYCASPRKGVGLGLREHGGGEYQEHVEDFGWRWLTVDAPCCDDLGVEKGGADGKEGNAQVMA